MAPVHADEVRGSAFAHAHHVDKGACQEGGEFFFRHLAGRHRELGVLVAPESRGEAADPNVVWRIDKARVCCLSDHQSGISVTVAGIATDETVRTDAPKISRLTDGGAVSQSFIRDVVF